MPQVKEAREAIKEATVVLQHLHAYVSSVGPDGDWPSWVNAHIPNAGQHASQCCRKTMHVTQTQACNHCNTQKLCQCTAQVPPS